MKCATATCNRKAQLGWAVCGDCLHRILYGHLTPSPPMIRRLAR